MSPVTGLAGLAGRILSLVHHMENFSQKARFSAGIHIDIFTKELAVSRDLGNRASLVTELT